MDPETITEVTDAMAAKAGEATSREIANYWHHAALVVRLFQNARRALRQYRQHAGFYAESAPEKAAVYREASALLTELTGVRMTSEAEAFELCAT
jgi:hypothetical protein